MARQICHVKPARGLTRLCEALQPGWMHMRRTLIVFAREPLPGRTKTRLTPPLSAEAAAALYGCFLEDTLATARRLADVRTVVAYAPQSAAPYFARLAPDLEARPQQGADLGARMEHALADALTSSDCVVIIGSDSPTLPPALLRQAFALLEHGSDIVIGPADDGGYYLFGARAPQPQLLREVPLSTPTVLAETLRLAASVGLAVALLPRWYDIDTGAELERLRQELATAHPTVAPRTRAYLQSAGAP